MPLPQIDILERKGKFILAVELDRKTSKVGYDIFWTNDEKWSEDVTQAMRFESEMDAHSYIESRRDYLQIMI